MKFVIRPINEIIENIPFVMFWIAIPLLFLGMLEVWSKYRNVDLQILMAPVLILALMVWVSYLANAYDHALIIDRLDKIKSK
jgi:hypothetical protein